jgi:regulation of enolase protein 1 (concanavalin A-like superfamily)
MPFAYDNSIAPYTSEATRTWDSSLDLTASDANTLCLWLRGYPASKTSFTGTGPFTMSATGGDIWGASDRFAYSYKKFNGNGSITVKVDSLDAPNDISAWAKVGIMMRETIDADSPHAMAVVTPVNRAALQYRTDKGQGSASSHMPVNSITLPHWLKLTRTGNSFEAQHSADGKTWEPIGTASVAVVPMPPDILVGFNMTANDPKLANVVTAQFSNLTIDGAVTGDWAQQDIGLKFNATDSFYITVEDTAGKSYTAVYPDAVISTAWTQLKVDTANAASAGVNLKRIKKIVIGVGNKTAPVKSGTGMLYIDDLEFGRSLPVTAE